MKRSLTPYFLMAPALLLMGLLLYGTADSLLQSIGYFPAAGLVSPTLSYYWEVLRDPALHASVLYSLYLSLVSAVVSCILGVAVSAALVSAGKTDHLFYRVPIAVSHVVTAAIMIALFSQTGLISRIAGTIGLVQSPNEFPLLVNDRAGIGLIAAYIWKQTPYVMSVVILLMRRVDRIYGETARTLCATKRQTFFHVTLPLCMPAISTAFVCIFAYSFGAYELPYLLGATVPQTFPVKAYNEFLYPDLMHRPYAMVYNALMLLFGGIFVALYLAAFKRATRNNKMVAK